VVVEGEANADRMSVTEAMTLKAAFRTSCEHPGFTMVRTWRKQKWNFKKNRPQ
jgi:hypothetical protein